MAPHAPPPIRRPPDPSEINPTTSNNIPTEQHRQQQLTDATIDEIIVPKIASQSTQPAISISEQNRKIPNRGIDSTGPKTPTLTISDHSILPSTNTDSQKIASTSPPPENNTSAQKRPIVNRPKEGTTQITPTHKVSDQTNHHSSPPDQLDNSSDLHTGKNGFPTNQSCQNQCQTMPSHRNNPFPKVSTNFDAPTSLIQQLNHKNSTTTPVRLNASETPCPTIQQLNHKCNHKSQNSTLQANPVKKNTPTVNFNRNVTTAPLPPSVVPTYAARLRACQSLDEPIIDLVPPLITTKQGLPAVLFNREDFLIKLASKCRFTLIGKFSSTMPKLEAIRSSLTSQLQITGECKVTHFNSTHVYIDLDNEFDHAIVWNKEKIYIDGRLMRLLVWTPTFRPEEETTISPVWVVLPQLPWHCYTMPFVSKLLEPVGRVLFFDAASVKRTRGSVAKVKIEIDITKPRPPHVWIGFPQDEGDVYGEGRWQELQFESVPEYCQYCKHQGHSDIQCKVKFKDEEYKMKKMEQEENKKEMQNQGNNASHHNKIHANAAKHLFPINEKVQSSKEYIPQQQDQQQPTTWQVKKKKKSVSAGDSVLHHVTDVVTHKHGALSNATKARGITTAKTEIATTSAAIGLPVHPDVAINISDAGAICTAKIPVQILATENSFDVLKDSVVEEHCAIDENASQSVKPFGMLPANAQVIGVTKENAVGSQNDLAPDISGNILQISGKSAAGNDIDGNHIDTAAVSGNDIQCMDITRRVESRVGENKSAQMVPTQSIQSNAMNTAPPWPHMVEVRLQGPEVMGQIDQIRTNAKASVDNVLVAMTQLNQDCLENKTAYTVPSQSDKLELEAERSVSGQISSKQNDEHDPQNSNTSMHVSPSHSANALIPTEELEVMFKVQMLMKLHGTNLVTLDIAKKLTKQEHQIFLKIMSDSGYLCTSVAKGTEEQATQQKERPPQQAKRVQLARCSKSNSTRGK